MNYVAVAHLYAGRDLVQHGSTSWWPAPAPRSGSLGGATLSGAHIRRIELSSAVSLLARSGLDTDRQLRQALGAFEPPSDLIGVVATVGGAVTTSLIVAVVPERRRLKVGTDLITAALYQERLVSRDFRPDTFGHSETARSFIEYLISILHSPPTAS